MKRRLGIIMIALIFPILLLLTGCTSVNTGGEYVDICEIFYNYSAYENKYVIVNGTLNETGTVNRWFVESNNSECRLVFSYSRYITQIGHNVSIKGRVIGSTYINGIRYPQLGNIKILSVNVTG